MRILVVEDEEKVRESLRNGLSETGFTVDVVGDGAGAIASFRKYDYALVVLDIMLPDLSGFDVLQVLRGERQDVRVLLLTAIDRVSDKITALNQGADDYMTKPYDFDELVARIHALLRRGANEYLHVLAASGLVLDRNTQTVHRDGELLHLTSREFALLEFLMLHKNQVVSRVMISQQVWKYGFEAESNVIDVYINYLRRKIDADTSGSLIRTIRGRGFILADRS